METAVNIGYACSLLHDSMTQFRVSGSTPEVEKLEAAGKLADAHRLAATKVQEQLQQVGGALAGTRARSPGTSCRCFCHVAPAYTIAPSSC